MTLHRQAPKRDANEGEIVEALRAAGASVQPLSAKGCPDLLVGYRGRTFLLEVKVGRARLTEDQEEWHETWEGQRVEVVRSVEAALQIIGAAN